MTEQAALLVRTEPDEFLTIHYGERSFIACPMDKDYSIGREIVLAEWMPTEKRFTGSIIRCRITGVILDHPVAPQGWAVIRFQSINFDPDVLPVDEIQSVEAMPDTVIAGG